MSIEQLKKFVTRSKRFFHALRTNQASFTFVPRKVAARDKDRIGEEHTTLLPGGRWLFYCSSWELFLWDLADSVAVASDSPRTPIAAIDISALPVEDSKFQELMVLHKTNPQSEGHNMLIDHVHMESRPQDSSVTILVRIVKQ